MKWRFKMKVNLVHLPVSIGHQWLPQSFEYFSCILLIFDNMISIFLGRNQKTSIPRLSYSEVSNLVPSNQIQRVWFEIGSKQPVGATPLRKLDVFVGGDIRFFGDDSASDWCNISAGYQWK